MLKNVKFVNHIKKTYTFACNQNSSDMKAIDKNVANALRLLGIATPFAEWESVEYENFSARYRIRVKDKKGADQEIIYDANWERILQIRFLDLERSLPSTEELKFKHYEKKKVSQAQR